MVKRFPSLCLRRFWLPAVFVFVWLLSLSASGRLVAADQPDMAPAQGQALNEGGAFIYLPVLRRPSLLVRLTAPTPTAGARFGWAVAQYGNQATISELPEPSAPGAGDTSGAVHIYRQLESGWTLLTSFASDESAGLDLYGYSVSMTSTVLVVGAPYADEFGADRGAVYIYEWVAGDWLFKAKRTGSGVTDGAHFGEDVVVFDDRIVVGAPDEATTGAAYVFDRAGGAWNQTARLTPGDTAAAIRFGAAVTLNEGLANEPIVVIGAPADTATCGGGTQDCGSVYAFRHDGGWVADGKLYAPTPADGMAFGSDVTFSINVLAVGHLQSDLLSVPTYFREGANNWIFDETVTTAGLTAADNFGQRLTGEDGSQILISAWGEEPGGAIYYYERAGDAWVEITGIVPGGADTAGSRFGHSLVVGNNQFAVGAYADDGEGTDAGAAYLGDLDDFAP